MRSVTGLELFVTRTVPLNQSAAGVLLRDDPPKNRLAQAHFALAAMFQRLLPATRPSKLPVVIVAGRD